MTVMNHKIENISENIGVMIIYSNLAPVMYISSAGNNFSLFTGHMSFQIFLLVGHLTNWAGHKTLTDNVL